MNIGVAKIAAVSVAEPISASTRRGDVGAIWDPLPAEDGPVELGILPRALHRVNLHVASCASRSGSSGGCHASAHVRKAAPSVRVAADTAQRSTGCVPARFCGGERGLSVIAR